MIPIVLAGGSGTRFWPLSRRNRPKQFLSPWDDERTLIEATVQRIAPLGDGNHPVHIICRPELVEPTREALSEPTNVVFIEEPAARNTAPAMALAAARLESKYGNEPLGFFPADHFVGDREGFTDCLRAAARRARDGAILTIGVAPTRPETGYGYIETTQPIPDNSDGPQVCPVERFVEKPQRSRAVEYLESDRYLWNSGMFVLQPSTLWEEFDRQHPKMFDCIERIRAALQQSDVDDSVVASAFCDMESISIDYAIMEQARRVEVVPAMFRWSDVGHWGALDEVATRDTDGNVVAADAVLDEVTDSTIVSEESTRLIAACGLEGMVIVDTPDALLVIPKRKAQKVREIVAELKRRDRSDVL